MGPRANQALSSFVSNLTEPRDKNIHYDEVKEYVDVEFWTMRWFTCDLVRA